MPDNVPELDPSARLTDSGTHQIGLAIPLALSGLVDALVVRAAQIGERTNRREVLSALILAAPKDPDELSELIRGYRTGTIADALVDQSVDELILQPTRPRGPRTTTRQQRARANRKIVSEQVALRKAQRRRRRTAPDSDDAPASGET